MNDKLITDEQIETLRRIMELPIDEAVKLIEDDRDPEGFDDGEKDIGE